MKKNVMAEHVYLPPTQDRFEIVCLRAKHGFEVDKQQVLLTLLSPLFCHYFEMTGDSIISKIRLH